MRVVAEREGDAKVAQGLGEADGERAEDRRRDDRQNGLEGASPARAVNTGCVLVFGPKTLQSCRDDEVRERQRSGNEHDDDAGRPEELAVDEVRIDAERGRGTKGLQEVRPTRVIIHVGIISKSHMAIVQNRRPKTLVRCTSHAMVVAIATANSDTTVATQNELKMARPEYP